MDAWTLGKIMNIEIFLHAITSYFVIIDPIGTSLIFHGLTDGGSKDYSVKMAVRTVIISTLIVMTCGFFGESFLARLGVSIESIRVAGGLLLFYTAFHMITKQNNPPETQTGDYEDISVYPMSIPFIAGPGCLTLTILLFSNSKTKTDILSIIIAVVIIYIITFFSFIMSSNIKNLIGKTGDDIIRRLLGVILAALAIQFIADGIKQIIG